MSGLVHNVCIIQHMIKHNVIPKGSDYINITCLFPIITYFIMTNTSFNIVDLLILYIKNVTIIRSNISKNKYNLALGH